MIAVQGNYLDEYLVRLERTWVRSMEVQKELGYVNDYTILVSTAAEHPTCGSMLNTRTWRLISPTRSGTSE